MDITLNDVVRYLDNDETQSPELRQAIHEARTNNRQVAAWFDEMIFVLEAIGGIDDPPADEVGADHLDLGTVV